MSSGTRAILQNAKKDNKACIHNIETLLRGRRKVDKVKLQQQLKETMQEREKEREEQCYQEETFKSFLS